MTIKQIVVALCVLVVSIACAQTQGQTPEHTLDELHRAASDADHEVYFGLFTEDAVFLGTDKTERWTIDEFAELYRPYMQSGKGWTYEVRDRNVTIRNEIAWFDERLYNEAYGNCRGSGVLERTDEGWKIAQYNLTFPVPNEIAKDVVELIREEENKTLRVLAIELYDNPASTEAAAQFIESAQIDIVAVRGNGVRALMRLVPGFSMNKHGAPVKPQAEQTYGILFRDASFSGPRGAVHRDEVVTHVNRGLRNYQHEQGRSRSEIIVWNAFAFEPIRHLGSPVDRRLEAIKGPEVIVGYRDDTELIEFRGDLTRSHADLGSPFQLWHRGPLGCTNARQVLNNGLVATFRLSDEAED